MQRRKCRKDWIYSECPKAITLEYLSKPIVDSVGNITELGGLIADDKAIDLDAWIDARTWLLGCPSQLVHLAGHLIKSQVTSCLVCVIWRGRIPSGSPLPYIVCDIPSYFSSP